MVFFGRIFLFLILFLSSAAVFAGERTALELGVRGGPNDDHNHEEYTAGEVYLLRALPWQVSLVEVVKLGGRLDAGVMMLEANGQHAAMVAIGGDLYLSMLNEHMEFEVGFRPTWLHDYKIGEDNFGGEFQFTSHAGMSLSWQRMNLSYRFQHTSNAGLYEYNPGLNLHLVGLGYRF